MREIKFKGFTEAEKKWVYGYLIKKDEEFYILENVIGTYSKSVNKRKNNIYDCLGGKFRIDLHHVDKTSIGQYTGLKDKNGVEIYEGDIIKLCGEFEESIGLMEYHNGCFFINEPHGNVLPICKHWSYEVEIVDNIYENFKILKEK